MTRPLLTLSEDFESPIVRARLDGFLHLASLLRPRLTELLDATEAEAGAEWHEIISILARIGTVQPMRQARPAVRIGVE